MAEIGIAERKERDKAAMREEILKAAREIAGREGVEGVSIRKIAGMIEYSPAILYHYFKNKDEIIEKLIDENYRRILEALSPLPSPAQPPEERLRQSAESFITLAVRMGDLYKSTLLNNSPTVLAHTRILQRGATAERPALAMLCKALRELPGLGEKEDEWVELTAQVIWSAAFGLSLRLIVEQTDEPQRLRLIDRTADFVLASLKSEAGQNERKPG